VTNDVQQCRVQAGCQIWGTNCRLVEAIELASSFRMQAERAHCMCEVEGARQSPLANPLGEVPKRRLIEPAPLTPREGCDATTSEADKLSNTAVVAVAEVHAVGVLGALGDIWAICLHCGVVELAVATSASMRPPDGPAAVPARGDGIIWSLCRPRPWPCRRLLSPRRLPCRPRLRRAACRCRQPCQRFP
jgi:hypothetical protein